MSKLFFVLTNFTILIFYLGCGENQPSEKKGESEKAAFQFILHDGKKWQMDEHTRNAITNLDSLLTSYKSIHSIDEHQLLGEKMDEELILLIRGCTMEGPAHDQLHVFLGSLYPKVQDLKKESSLALSKTNLTVMKKLMTEYHSYFE